MPLVRIPQPIEVLNTCFVHILFTNVGTGMAAKIYQLGCVRNSRTRLTRLFSMGTNADMEGLRSGMLFSQNGCFSSAEVESYVRLTGDGNPIHINPSAAREAGFGACVVPGMLCGSLFPAIIGSRFAGAVYVSQDLKFKAPVLVGESFLAEVEVSTIVKLRQHAKVTFLTRCMTERQERQPILVDGQAVALLPMR